MNVDGWFQVLPALKLNVPELSGAMNVPVDASISPLKSMVYDLLAVPRVAPVLIVVVPSMSNVPVSTDASPDAPPPITKLPDILESEVMQAYVPPSLIVTAARVSVLALQVNVPVMEVKFAAVKL